MSEILADDNIENLDVTVKRLQYNFLGYLFYDFFKMETNKLFLILNMPLTTLY